MSQRNGVSIILIALMVIFVYPQYISAQSVTDISNFTEDKNSGYENKYLDLYKKGISSSLPSFGGRIQEITFCMNDGVRWLSVSSPRSGSYIWSPSVTKTYAYGPPSYRGQYVLGLFAPYYFCLVSVNPIVVFPGILITMMGSSR